jgi:NitT/TauT family transport system permease protein
MTWPIHAHRLSSIPKVAVVPIFVLWFGAGAVPAVLTAMILYLSHRRERRDRARHRPGSGASCARSRHPDRDSRNVGLRHRSCRISSSLKVAVAGVHRRSSPDRHSAAHRQPDDDRDLDFDVPLVFAGLLSSR